jgi:ferredoxin
MAELKLMNYDRLKKPSKVTMRRPVVELSECILCGICTDLCPLVFRMNHAGYVEVVELDEYPDEDVNEVIKHCINNCIKWDE